jgi:hypothetical protein
MPSVRALLAEVDERPIARRIAIPHDEARMSFPLRSNTVRDLDEFTDITASYVQHHYARCVALGGRLSRSQAAGRAKEILNQHMRRQGGDYVSAYQDAHDGVNGGMRTVLDVVCDSIKEEAIEYYMRDAFDRHMPPDDWHGRKEMVRQFIQHCGVALPGIDPTDPARYARDIESLIRAFIRGLRQMSAIFRRL